MCQLFYYVCYSTLSAGNFGHEKSPATLEQLRSVFIQFPYWISLYLSFIVDVDVRGCHIMSLVITCQRREYESDLLQLAYSDHPVE